jgi:Tol biopolymer transport system component
MTITAPPRPPRLPVQPTSDELEALIEEARRRARRRRLRNAAAAVAAAAIAPGVFAALQAGGQTEPSAKGLPAARRSKPVPLRPAPRNGEIALVRDNALIAVRPDGAGRRQLTACPGPRGDCNFGTFSWSPDGRLLAFLAGHFGGAFTVENLSLYTIGADGSTPRLLARCGDCNPWQELSWSPGGRRIVFSADNGLFVVNVSSGLLRRLDVPPAQQTAMDGPGAGTTATLSPNGSTIAFAAGNELYTVSKNGSGLSRIADRPGILDPKWSPDGTKLAFDAGDNVYVVDADGTHLKLLLDGTVGSGPGVPAWSPNGRRILYFYTPGSPNQFRGEVWSMKADGSDRRRLYAGSCCVGYWRPPIWSPDGRWIVVSGATDESGIEVMDARGTHRRKLLDVPSVTAWQPLPRS